MQITSALTIISCHLLWGLFPVGSRYLTVFATPRPFTILSVLIIATLLSGVTGLALSQRAEKFFKSSSKTPPQKTTATKLKAGKLLLLFGVVAAARAMTNLASMAKTKAAYTQIINSLSPVIAALIDRFIFKVKVKNYLFIAVFFSFLGCGIIAISRSLSSSGNTEKPLSVDDLIGCALQFCSMFFSVWSRFLMRQTAPYYGVNMLVHVQNLSTFSVSMIASLAFFSNSGNNDDESYAHWQRIDIADLTFNNIFAFLFLSCGIIVLGSFAQMNAIRKHGVSMYSSFSSCRIVFAILGAYFVLDEGVGSILEWVGISVVCVSITCYLVRIHIDTKKRELEIEKEHENGSNL